MSYSQGTWLFSRDHSIIVVPILLFFLQTWDYIEIEPMHHRTILGKSGSNVQLIENELNVRIKFPDQQGGGGRSQQGDSPIHNAQLNALALAGGSKPPPQQPNQVCLVCSKELFSFPLPLPLPTPLNFRHF